VAELDREGLRHEELPSGREWAVAARKWGRATARELGRCTGLRLTLLEIAFYCAAHVGIVDCRALSVIARKRKIGRRALCAGLAELERRGYMLRVFRAGVRLARDECGRVVEVQPDDERALHNVQRGWETSSLLPVGLVKFVPLMPPGRERKARATLAELTLKDPRVRAAIAAKGNTIPGGIPRSSPAPQAGSAGDVTTRPAGLANMQTSASIGTQSVTRSVSSVVLDRSQVTPTPAAPRDVKSAGGAVAPSPHIAPAAASTVLDAPSCTVPPAAGERQSGPRLVSPSPATTGSAPRPPAVPPATPGPRVACSRSEARPTLPEHLQGLDVPAPKAVDWLVEHGWPRGEAWTSVKGYRKSAWWRAHRDARGEPPGRKLRYRGAARELEALQRDETRAVVEEGERGFSVWTKLRGELANRATEAEWYGLFDQVECRAEKLGGPGLIILDLDGPKEARARVAQIAATLPIRVQIAWPQPPPPPVVAEADRWPVILGSWARDPGDTVWATWLRCLRLIGWAQEDGALVVRVTADMDVLARLRSYRDGMSERAFKALGIPVRVSMEAS
jgi:hypothetical protein